MSALPDPRVGLIVEAYRLIDRIQDPDASPSEVDRFEATLPHPPLPDVHALAHWARLLHARLHGGDTGAPLQAMREWAERSGDPALLALTLATAALTDAVGAPGPAALAAGGALTRAVVLLDEGSPWVAHRCAALIEVGLCFHERAMWELARQHYDLADAAWPADADPAWQPVRQVQRRVARMNRLDILVDGCCALAELGDWPAAAERAAQAWPQVVGEVEHVYPPQWLGEVHGFCDLLAALAGLDGGTELAHLHALALQAGIGASGRAMAGLAEAVRARHAGDPDRAARLAASLIDALGYPVPSQARLLALHLASSGRDTPPLARRYAAELAHLRWEARLARDRALRSTIEAERQQAEHHRLRRQVLTDELTGLSTRRAYQAYLAALVQRPGPARHPGEVALMMIDIDHFKAINDRHGHDLGDAVLRQLGAILAGHVRAGDLAARLGGDEFVVVLDQVDRVVAESRAAAIVRAVSAHAWDTLAPGLAVSVSLGLSMSNAAGVDALRARADQALYQAKRAGRNRLAYAPSGSAVL